MFAGPVPRERFLAASTREGATMTSLQEHPSGLLADFADAGHGLALAPHSSSDFLELVRPPGLLELCFWFEDMGA